jgi:hypothetical protein
VEFLKIRARAFSYASTRASNSFESDSNDDENDDDDDVVVVVVVVEVVECLEGVNSLGLFSLTFSL